MNFSFLRHLAFVSVAILLGIACGGSFDASENSGAVVGEPFRFSAPDLQGNTVTSEDPRFENKVVLVDIWGTWCPPCLDAIPHLVELQRRFGPEGFEIVGVAFENGRPDIARNHLRRFAAQHNINYTVLHGGQPGGSMLDALPDLKNFEGFPTAVLIGPDGRVADVTMGFHESMLPELEADIRELLSPA